MADASPQPFRIDDRVVRPALNEIEGPGGVERVSPRAMDLLVALAARPDGMASKQELLDAVWTDLFVGDEVLSTAIWELRKAMGDDARTPRFIRTIPRRGDRLWALATADGAVRWSAPTVDWAVADPVPAGDLVLVGACDGTVLALDRASGAERWRAAVHGDTWYTPAVVADLMILGSADGHVYAVELATGAERWRTATGNRVLSSIAPWRDLVLAGSHDRRLWALEAATGRVAWRVRTPGAVSSPAVAGNLAAFGSPDGWITLLEL